MRNMSIVTKIVAFACGIVSILLILGSFALIEFEVDMVEGFTEEHLEKINAAIEDRKNAEEAALQENVDFKLKILNGFGALYIHHFEAEELKNSLKLFMDSPEILAINVLDEDGSPFAAAWKSPDMATGDALPKDIELNEDLSVQMDSIIGNKKIGSFQIYYTDSILKEKIIRIRKELKAEAENFKRTSYNRLHRAIFSEIIGVFVILLALMICLVLTLRPMVLRPVKIVSNVARRLANFDLTASVKTRRRDEIGILLIAINDMVQEFRKIVSDVKSGGKRLADTAAQMTQNISTIATATEEMSVNVQDVSNSAVQMSQNATAVAGAIEEMSASINEAGRSARQGSHVARDAVEMADKAKEAMSSLGEAAIRIGEVTEVIKRIAENTALLALNADIEAASAGEAGKGFAVVANEIKEFARQSAQAADDIAARISVMQENTKQAVHVIGEVSGIINTINSSSENITFSLEDQMKAVDEIAANVLQADARANEIAASIAQLAQGANEVSMNVGIAARGKEGTGEETMKGHYMDASAAEVARLAEELLELVDKFKDGGEGYQEEG